MRFEQVRELLDHTRVFHGRLAAHYEALAGDEQRERTRMLLDYVANVERTLERALEDYEAQASRLVLDTWLDFVLDDRFLARIEELGAGAALDTDALVREALALHGAVIAAYEALDLDAVPPEVAAVLEDVVTLERQLGKRLSIAAGAVRDL